MLRTWCGGSGGRGMVNDEGFMINSGSRLRVNG